MSALDTVHRKIAIVTVTYNDLEGVRDTYENICVQHYRDFDWIVVDGGSTDGTVEYLHSLNCPFLTWSSEEDEGIYDAMNRGVSMCNGEYVVFMNAGDTFFNSGALAKAAKLLLVDPGVDILFGGAMLSFPYSGRMVYRPPRLVEDSLWHGLPANHQATFYRRALLDETPYDLQYTLCGDYYLAVALMKKGAHVTYLNSPLATFKVGGQSYKRIGHLFSEPYRIQRDVLGSPLYYRVASVMKRFISTLGFVLLSQRIPNKKNDGGA